MSAPRKFDDETRARAIRMYEDRLKGGGISQIGVRREIGELLGVRPETIRGWIRRELGARLADAGLVDRYHLLVFPVFLGAGKRLFSTADKDATQLKVTEYEMYSNGVQKIVYDVVR